MLSSIHKKVERHLTGGVFFGMVMKHVNSKPDRDSYVQETPIHTKNSDLLFQNVLRLEMVDKSDVKVLSIPRIHLIV